MNWYNRQLKISKREWTNEELEQIEKLVKEHIPFHEIARMFNTHPGTIYGWNKKYKWRDVEQEKLDKDKMIAGLFLLPPDGQGLTLNQIMNEYGIGTSRVYKALERLGLKDKIKDRKKKIWENPERVKQISERRKQRYIDNPELRDEMARIQEQRYIDNPELRDEMARIQKQRFINNPELRQQVSKQRKKHIEEIGGFEGMLRACSTRQKAMSMLNGFINSLTQKPGADFDYIYTVYKKYLQIINNHTYPDEVQQQTVASMNWYKKAQINRGKVKYKPDGSFFVLCKNTKVGEGPWRISYFNEGGKGWTHRDFSTYEEAEAVFNYSYGTEGCRIKNMNWYKRIKANIPRTLYHGTSINNYDSIKNIGLIPETGNFVTDSYADEYEAAGVEFDPVPLTYAVDKENLGNAVTAMMNAVANMVGKNWLNDITLDELKSYGMLVIMKEGEEHMERRPVEEEGPWGDWQGETDNRYPAVEPGDYFSEEAQGPVEILIGNKMVDFLRKNGEWPPSQLKGSIEEIRKQLLTMAIRYHIKKSPEQKDRIIQGLQQKINSLTEEEVRQSYKLYSEKTNELV